MVSNRQLLVVDATPGASFKDFKLKSGAANPGPVGPVGPVLPGESGDDLVRLSGEVHILIATLDGCWTLPTRLRWMAGAG